MREALRLVPTLRGQPLPGSGRVVDADGAITRAVLDTVNGYSFTSLAAVVAARRVPAGDARPGFRTPVEVFGSSFAETIADTRITFIDPVTATRR
jgi:hypothetical protein